MVIGTPAEALASFSSDFLDVGFFHAPSLDNWPSPARGDSASGENRFGKGGFCGKPGRNGLTSVLSPAAAEKCLSTSKVGSELRSTKPALQPCLVECPALAGCHFLEVR